MTPQQALDYVRYVIAVKGPSGAVVIPVPALEQALEGVYNADWLNQRGRA